MLKKKILIFKLIILGIFSIFILGCEKPKIQSEFYKKELNSKKVSSKNSYQPYEQYTQTSLNQQQKPKLNELSEKLSSPRKKVISRSKLVQNKPILSNKKKNIYQKSQKFSKLQAPSKKLNKIKPRLKLQKKSKKTKDLKSYKSKTVSNFILVPGISYYLKISEFEPLYYETTKNKISLFTIIDSNFNPNFQILIAKPNEVYLDIPENLNLENPPYPHINETKCSNNLEYKSVKFDILKINSKEYKFKISNLNPQTTYCFKLKAFGNSIEKNSKIVKVVTLSDEILEYGYPITFTGILKTSAIFTREFSPYYLPEDWVIEKGVKAEFEKGVVVNVGEGVKIIVKGSIKSNGTKINPVIFQGIGKWQGFEFIDKAQQDSDLKNLIIKGI